MNIPKTLSPVNLSPSIERLAVPLSNETTAKIKSLAKDILLNVSLAFLLNVTMMAFVATPFSAVVLTGALIGALGAGIGQAAIDLYYQNKDFEEVKKEFEPLKHVSQASMINVVGLAGPNIAIHEAGHALAAASLFKNAGPEIQIFPFLGGMTKYTYSHGLTKLGSFIGQQRAFMFVTAAGFLASTFFAMFEFGLADQLKDSYPTISRLMTVHGVLQISQEVLYGLTAFLASKVDLAHDFVNLWVSGGIHPLIPIALMITLPLLEIWLLNYLACREKSQKIQEVAQPFYVQAALAHQTV